MFVPDPIGLKLVKSFAQPGGNVTGFVNFGRDLVGKRLQSLKEQSAQEPQLTDARRQFEIALGQLEESRRRLAETQKKAAAIAPKSGATLIGTVFAIDVGETVVVGTSHLGGGQKALIALLTAVPRGKP